MSMAIVLTLLKRSCIVAGMKKNQHAVALGRKGGKKGGPARAAKLSPERRREIARNAVMARWKKEKARKSRLLKEQ
jgi:hypothetical protein